MNTTTTTQKRGREEGRGLGEAEAVLPKRPKSSSLAVRSALPGTTSSKSDEGIPDDDDYTSSSGTSSSHEEDDDDSEQDEEPIESANSIAETITHHQNTRQRPLGPQNNAPESKDDDDTITYVPGRPKPNIQRIQPPRPDDESGLLSRLSSFLPQLQAANADLESRIASGGNLHDMILDDVKEGEEGQYIEMNLGLGVLKEKRKKTRALDNESTSSSEESEDDAEDEHPKGEDEGEGHVMDQLMGLKNRSQRTKPDIQEVDDG